MGLPAPIAAALDRATIPIEARVARHVWLRDLLCGFDDTASTEASWLPGMFSQSTLANAATVHAMVQR